MEEVKTILAAGKQIKIRRVEFFDDRWYKIEYFDPADASKIIKDYFVSTTTVQGIEAKQFLARWRGDIGNREADLRVAEGANRGTRVHNAWSIACQGGVVIYNPMQSPNYSREDIDRLREETMDRLAILPDQLDMRMFIRLRDFYNIVKPFKVITEGTVFSLKHRRAGTLDNILGIAAGEYDINGGKPLKLERGLYVADVKTGKAVDDEDAGSQISDYAMMVEEMAELGIEWARELIEEYGNIVGGLILQPQAKTKKGIEGFATTLIGKDELVQGQVDMSHLDAMWRRRNKAAKPDLYEFPSLVRFTNTTTESKGEQHGNQTDDTR